MAKDQPKDPKSATEETLAAGAAAAARAVGASSSASQPQQPPQQPPQNLGSGASPAGVGWPPRPNVNVEATEHQFPQVPQGLSLEPIWRDAPPAELREDDDDEERPDPNVDPFAAVVQVRQDGAVCRPPVGKHTSLLGSVVIGNWVGNVDGKPVDVLHGTPLHGLPPAIVRALRNTRGQKIGPYPPPAAPGA